MLFEEKLHGMDRLHGTHRAYKHPPKFTFNVMEAHSEYHWYRKNYKSDLFTSQTLMHDIALPGGNYVTKSDMAKLVGLYCFVQDEFTGPIPLMDLPRTISLLEFVAGEGGECEYQVEKNYTQRPKKKKRFQYSHYRVGKKKFGEAPVNVAVILGWLKNTPNAEDVHRETGTLSLPSPDFYQDDFFVEHTKRRADRLATGPFGLLYIEECFKQCQRDASMSHCMTA